MLLGSAAASSVDWAALAPRVPRLYYALQLLNAAPIAAQADAMTTAASALLPSDATEEVVARLCALLVSRASFLPKAASNAEAAKLVNDAYLTQLAICAEAEARMRMRMRLAQPATHHSARLTQLGVFVGGGRAVPHASRILPHPLACMHREIAHPAPSSRMHAPRAHGVACPHSQLAPISAIVGGMIASEVIKIISGKERPINNALFFDGATSDGLCQRLGPSFDLGPRGVHKGEFTVLRTAA